MSNKLEVRLLGKFEIKSEGKPIAITSRPAQSLFAYLILNAGTSHRREKLAGLLWPDSLEETARENLRHALWRMRKALEAASSSRFLQADDISIGFRESSDYWLDAAELEKLSEEASTDELTAVLLNYQGELLPGFYDEWVTLEREHLYSTFEGHMARLMAFLQAENRWLDILDWGERWIKLGEKPEPAYRALMSAHAAKGDMSKVVSAYQRCVKSLKEFGVEPSQETCTLYERLKAARETFETVTEVSRKEKQEAPPKTNLPVPLSSFVGREREIEELKRLLSSTRLLTLTGTGGIGKTRLAIQMARDSLPEFKDGVFWVNLVGLSDENLIPQEIGKSLNVREVSNESMIETLKTYLRSKDLLLVIDNCEHLIQGCAQCIEQLLGSCPKLKILATSIEALDLFHEIIWQVPALSVPRMEELPSLGQLQEFASIELFLDRAIHVRSDFILNEKNVKPIIQICQRLEGIPLAIELAAARVKVLSADEVATRLNDRFSLLTAGSRTASPRHQTLRATIDWSYELLTEAEQTLLRRLSVFVGGFNLEAAEAICGWEGLKPRDILDLLGRLVDKSLMNVERVNATGDTRYRLLETIREYSFIRLTESAEATLIREEHLKYFTKWVEEIGPKIFGRDQVLLVTRIETEMDNLRAALDWSMSELSQDTAALLKDKPNSLKGTQRIELCYQLGEVLNWQAKYTEAIDLYHLMLRSAQDLDDLVAQTRALQGLAYSLGEKGDHIGSLNFARRAETFARKADAQQELVKALWMQGMAHYRLGAAKAALLVGEQALSLAKEMNDTYELARSLNLVAAANYISGKYDLAENDWENALKIFQELGNKQQGMTLLSNLGVIADARGDYETAFQRYHSALQIAREIGNRDGEIYILSNCGGERVALGDYLAAEADLRKTIEMVGTEGSWCLPNAYGYLAEAYLGQDKTEEAREAALKALTLALDSDTPEYIGIAWRVLGVISGQMGTPVMVQFKKVVESIRYSTRDCFTISEEILAANGIDGERARTLRDWAKYELSQGNQERGVEMWQQARKIFEELGATFEAGRMKTLPIG